MEQNEREQEVESLEKEAKFTIISMNDEDDADEGKKKILEEAKEEVARLYQEFRDWLDDNVNSDEVNERLERLKQETSNLMNRTKQSIQSFQEREDVHAGKQKAKELGSKVYESINDGINDVMNNEHVVKVVDSVSDTIDNVRNDERVKQGVKKFKKETLKIAESAFNGLKRVLDTEDDQHNDQKG